MSKTIKAEMNRHFISLYLGLPNAKKTKGGSPGLVVRGGDSYQRVVSLNLGARYWMDIFSHFLL